MRSHEDKRSTDFFRLHAEICQAISHPKRLQILSLLRDSELSVSELAGHMRLNPANVSQQLGVMRRAGVVTRRREGTTAHYRITSLKILRAYDLMTEVLEQRLADGIKALSPEPSGEVA